MRDRKTERANVKRLGLMVMWDLRVLDMAVRTDLLSVVMRLLGARESKFLGGMMDAREGGQAWPKTGPEGPTAAERAWHELAHFPPASWCRSCVEGKGIDDRNLRTRKERTEEFAARWANDTV